MAESMLLGVGQRFNLPAILSSIGASIIQDGNATILQERGPDGTEALRAYHDYIVRAMSSWRLSANYGWRPVLELIPD